MERIQTEFTRTVRSAEGNAAERTAQVLDRHAQALGKERVREHFYGQIDYHTPALHVGHIGERVGESIGIFREDQLEQIKDVDSFHDACREFAENEIYKLMYVQNDRISAHIARDYFRDFMEDATQALSEKGLLPEAEKARFTTLLRYLDQGIEAYTEMGYHLLDLTDGEHRGLVSMARELMPEHTVAPENETYGIADEALADGARQLYHQILAKRGIHVNQPYDVPPHYFLIGLLTDKIALERVARQQHGKFNWNSQKDTELLADTAEALFKEALARGARHYPHEVMPEIVDGLKTLLRTERACPEHFPALVKHAAKEAQAKAAAGLGEYPATEKNAYIKSQWFVDQFDMGAMERVQKLVPEKLKDIRRALEECETVSELTSICNHTATDLTEAVLFRGYEPRILHAAKTMIGQFRAALKPSLDLTAHTNRAAIMGMEQAVQVLEMGIQSHEAAREWFFADTKGAWDSYYMKGLLAVSAESGLNPIHFGYPQYEMVYHHGREEFRDSLKERGLTGPILDSPFVPHLYDKAYELAEWRAPVAEARPERFTDRIRKERGDDENGLPQTGGKENQKLQQDAVKILREAINRLPRELNHKGKKLKPSLDSVESLVAIEADISQQIAMLQERRMGRVH